MSINRNRTALKMLLEMGPIDVLRPILEKEGLKRVSYFPDGDSVYATAQMGDGVAEVGRYLSAAYNLCLRGDLTLDDLLGNSEDTFRLGMENARMNQLDPWLKDAVIMHVISPEVADEYWIEWMSEAGQGNTRLGFMDYIKSQIEQGGATRDR